MLDHEERLFRFVYSIADSKSRLEKTLKSHNEVRMEHLLKLYFYPEVLRDRDGWKRSVYSSLNKVPLLKNNKYPDFQFLYEQVWVKPFEGKLLRELDRRVLFISRSLPDYESPQFPLGESVVANCYEICERYSSWLADTLSVVGRLFWIDIYEKIDSLMGDSVYVK
jgi:hypothetical protein